MAMLPLTATPSQAVVFANQVLDFFDSGTGPIAGPYGGTTSPSNFPVSVPLSVAVDGDANTFLSLPTDSFVTVGFSGAVIIDGPGNDIFISEPGNGLEVASVLVSSDGGSTFELLGQAFGDTVTELDLATIGFTGTVNAVRIVGLDNGGSSPGFDVAFVQGLEGSVTVIPVPASVTLLLFGVAGLVTLKRRAPQT